MSIQEFGALGEGIGSLLILITLVYLAVQNKQQQRLLLSSVFQARTGLVLDLSETVVIDNSFAEIVAKVEAGEELSAVERVRIRSWHYMCWKTFENNHFQNTLRVLDSSQLQTTELIIERTLGTTEGLEYWYDMKYQFRADFVTWVEDIIHGIEQEELAT